MIDYLDLVGRPMDCKGAVGVALMRMGFEVPADLWLGDRDLWAETSDPVPRMGDVILSHPDGRPHVCVVIDEVQRLCLTSTQPGGVCTVDLSRAMADRTGVYRIRGGRQ